MALAHLLLAQAKNIHLSITSFCTTTLNNIFEEGMDVKEALEQSQETLENEFGGK